MPISEGKIQGTEVVYVTDRVMFSRFCKTNTIQRVAGEDAIIFYDKSEIAEDEICAASAMSDGNVLRGKLQTIAGKSVILVLTPGTKEAHSAMCKRASKLGLKCLEVNSLSELQPNPNAGIIVDESVELTQLNRSFRWVAAPANQKNSELSNSRDDIAIFNKPCGRGAIRQVFDKYLMPNMPEFEKVKDELQQLESPALQSSAVDRYAKSLPIEFVVLDIDGSFTTEDMWISEKDNIAKVVAKQDIEATKKVSESGITFSIITGNSGDYVTKIAELTGINSKSIAQNSDKDKKVIAAEMFLKDYDWRKVGFLCDGAGDIPLARHILERGGQVFAVANAVPELKLLGRKYKNLHQLEFEGGKGAASEMCSIIKKHNIALQREQETGQQLLS